MRGPLSRTNGGAALWIGCLQYFAAEAIAIRAWVGAYSLGGNYISDLGAVSGGHSPLHRLMNAAFVLQGALILGGSLLVRPSFPSGWLASLALGLVAASGLGVTLVGLAPEDVAPGWHYLGAAENFLFCNAGAALTGVALLSRRPLVGALGVIAGAIGLIGLACIALQNDLGLGAGGIERVAAYPFPLWIAGMGAWLMLTPRRENN